MAKRKLIKEVKRDFSPLSKEHILAILLYGSYVKDENHSRSDIDICIVAPQYQQREELLNEVYRKIDVYTKKYDVRIFEQLPLYLQIAIIKNHEIIYTKDIYELHEYFYFFRKLWNDQKHRQTLTKQELTHFFS
jgi:hypothetical protein